MLKFALLLAMQLAGSAETRDRYRWNRLVDAIPILPVAYVCADGKAVRELRLRPSLTVSAGVFAIFGDEAAAEDQ